jgi:hypothetical protein
MGEIMINSILGIIAILVLAATASASNFSNNVLLSNESVNFETFTTSNYYDQFLFEIQGDCKELNSIWFLQTHAWEPANIGTNNLGRPVEAELSIQLFKDGSYWAEYGEHSIKEIRPDGISYDTLFAKKGLQGIWKAFGTKIEISGLGSGIAATYTSPVSGKQLDSFKFTLTTKINDQRAVNSVMNITRSGTNMGPKGISINQFCGIN